MTKRHFRAGNLTHQFFLILIFTCAVAANAFANENEDKAFQLHAIASTIGYHAFLASYGDPHEMRWLQESRDAFENALNGLSLNFEDSGTTPRFQIAKTSYLGIRRLWDTNMREHVNEVLARQNILLALPAQIKKIHALANKLWTVSDETVEIGALEGVKADLLYLAARQGMLSARVAKNVVIFGQTLDAEHGRADDL
jgi:twitching motility protein PilJ